MMMTAAVEAATGSAKTGKLPSERFRELNAHLREAVKARPIAHPGLEMQSMLDLLDERLGRAP